MPIKTYRKHTIETKNKLGPGSFLVWTLSAILVFVGALFITLSTGSFFKSLASQTPFLKPVTNDYLEQSQFAFTELSNRWSNDSSVDFKESFQLAIPKLEINSATVQTHSTSLTPDTFIGHLKGSALPADSGQVILYGHSTLPTLFDPTNYKTIFSKLDQLNSGDSVKLTYGDQQYLYKVGRVEVIETEDLIERLGNSKRKELVLITCYPFGTTQKRLVVFASPIGQ